MMNNESEIKETKMKRIVSIILVVLILCSGAAWASGEPSGVQPPEERIGLISAMDNEVALLLDEAEIDDSVRRIVQVKKDAGLFEDPFLESIPTYDGRDCIVLNDNRPDFAQEYLDTATGENYSELDGLGRCGVAVALLDLITLIDADATVVDCQFLRCELDGGTALGYPDGAVVIGCPTGVEGVWEELIVFRLIAFHYAGNEVLTILQHTFYLGCHWHTYDGAIAAN